ncbi:MAG: acyl-CoA desaturase, partial [Leptospiraceae bacterium]|nr:acyl-CoA desaturase [Leptospiraceae bacterium]
FIAYTVIAALHVIVVLGILSGVEARDWIMLVAVYLACGMVGVNAGLHRYFSHRAFRTSRVFQFILGWLGAVTMTDPISFAGKHRIHHRYSDTERDVHGPRFGFWQSWFGSLVDHGYTKTELQARVKDLTGFPELMLLHRVPLLATATTGALIWWLGGFSMFAVGYVLALLIFINLAGATNYFCHKYGSRRYNTDDTSTNNMWVNLITMGEGWHHNHHYYQASANCGFFWYEWDPTYWSIRLLAILHIVWDVKTVPLRVRDRLADNAELAAHIS